MHEITITYKDVKGFEKPMPSSRPRFKRVGRSVRTYMSPSYMEHKEYIKRQLPRLELTGPISLKILFGLPIPRSTSNVKRLKLLDEYVTKKPDLDNLLKTFMDAGNKHLWLDDSQVVSIVMEKRYVDTPVTKVIIEEV